MIWVVDTNVLLRRAQINHPDNEVAGRALEHLLTDGCDLRITSQIVREFWSVATRPLAANGLGLSSGQADAAVKDIFPRLPDHPQTYDYWRQLVRAKKVSGKQVHDAWLAASLIAAAITNLLTFDTTDFKRYSEVEAVHPTNLP